MKNNAKFDFDLTHGEYAEGIAATILKSRGSKVEIKHERLTNFTGNLAIEYESRGKKSGIAITTADWWIVFIDDEWGEPTSFVGLHIPELKRFLKLNWNRLRKTRGGDENTSQLILLPLRLVLRNMTERP